MRRWIVTGGAGFMGINLVRYLLERGDSVTSLDIADFDYPERDRVRIVTGDIRDMEVVRESMKDGDIVVHGAAALPSYDDEDVFTTDLDGSRNVLEAAREAGIRRVVHVSTTAVYGTPEQPVDEDADLVDVGPYSYAKIEAEKVCAEYRDHGMCVPILRPKTFVGPERLGVFALLYDWARDGRGFPVLGKGTNHYQLLDVEDLCRAIWISAEADREIADDVFNIGATEFGTMREDFQAVLDRAGHGRKVVPLPAWPARVTLRVMEALGLSPLYKWVYDTATQESVVLVDRAREKLGFVPEYSNSESLIRNYEWYLENIDAIEGAAGGVSHRAAWKQGILGLAKRFF